MSRNPPLISDESYFINKLDDLPERRVMSNVVECAEKNRVFPEGSPFPGPQRYKRTPYMREIAMELSPQRDTEEVVIMKCGQGGATAGATEPLLLFKVMDDPGPVLAITANDELAKTWGEERLDQMFEQSGAQKKFRSTTKKNTQHGGNGSTTLKKTWPGGRLDIKTYGKISQIRQISYQIVILEEEEEAAAALKARGAKQGKFRDVAYARTRAYRGRRKILRVSTPLIKETSEIYKAFLAGDQRYFYVPCPKCGEMQRLEWKNLKYSTNEHKVVDPDSVYYECKSDDCSYKMRNEDKSLMLSLGEWRAHNKEKARPRVKSYHFNALYVPPGMDTWADLAQQWVDAQGDPEKLQVFVNLNLGEPFEDQSEAPPPETLHVLKGSYQRGHMPKPEEGFPLYAMMGVDVQQGNKRGGEWVPGKEARLEASLVGFGLNNRTWLIEHYVIKGEVTDWRSGAWKKFRDMIVKKKFPLMPEKIFIDSRHETATVKQFCNGATNIFPIMGDGRIKDKEFKQIDLLDYRSADGSPLRLYELKTNPLKRLLYNRLGLRYDQIGKTYPDGYMMFPVDIHHKYFEQLTAERPVPIMKNGKKIGVNWDAGGRSNEALDCFVYAIAANKVYMYEVCIEHGEEATNERKFEIWAARKYAHMLAA